MYVVTINFAVFLQSDGEVSSASKKQKVRAACDPTVNSSTCSADILTFYIIGSLGVE